MGAGPTNKIDTFLDSLLKSIFVSILPKCMLINFVLKSIFFDFLPKSRFFDFLLKFDFHRLLTETNFYRVLIIPSEGPQNLKVYNALTRILKSRSILKEFFRKKIPKKKMEHRNFKIR